MRSQGEYSIYEAKARFSELIRLVRERGAAATITWHGKPVAELRPINAGDDGAARLTELEATGAISRARAGSLHDVLHAVPLPSGGKGALARFMADRDE